MSTVTIVRKNGYVSIAADTQTSFGPRKVSPAYTRQAGKLVKAGESFLGVAGWAVSQQVLEHAFRPESDAPAFRTTTEIFEVFLSLHMRLKQDYFLVPRGVDFDAYEPSHMTVLIANAHGIFGVYSLREVFEYERFWAVGSGSEYALGAMHAVYDAAGDARAVAEAGVRAGVEFDSATGAPIESYVVRLASEPVEELDLLLKV